MTRRKKYLFVLIGFLLTVGVVELFSFVLFFIVTGKSFSFAEYQKDRMYVVQHPRSQEAPEGGYMDWGSIKEVIHPYLGYVRDPKKMKNHSDYGFPGKNPPITEKKDNTTVVGIFGGSFAEEFSKYGRNALKIELKKSPKFNHKKIIFHTIAMGGYKQPQQVMALMYFLTLESHFDIVINIDGFNDIVLPRVENIPKKTFPFYPRAWWARVLGFNHPTGLALLGEIRADWAKLFSMAPLKYSIASNMIWKSSDMQIFRKIKEKEIELLETEIQREKNVSYLGTGPSFSFDDELEIYEESANYWERCSVQMKRICEANNIAYFHFLQPTYHLRGSRATGDEESEKTHLKSPYHKPVVAGYPYLLRKGQDLKNQGVNFYDLTMIFSNYKENFYRDECCHINRKGYEIIGTNIGEIIFEYFGKTKHKNGTD